MNLIKMAFFRLIQDGIVSIEEARAFLALYEGYDEQCLEILNEYIERMERQQKREKTATAYTNNKKAGQPKIAVSALL